jgi:hypothetical protein
MKKLFVFAAAFISFTGFTFSGNYNSTQTAVNTPAAPEDFRYFRIHRQAKNVVLNWSSVYTSGVNSFVIERSYDGDFFDVINQMPASSETRHTWKDMNVFPGYIHYRVGCIMNDGTTHYSATEIIRIVSHG